MTTQKYLCPPRLQKKFLLWWWTVPELILIATLVVATFYLTSLELLALTLFVAIGAARVDFEHNLFGALRTRTLYHLFTKTFTANEKRTAKEEKRQRKRLTKQMRSRLPIQDLIQFRFADNGIYGGKDGKELFRFYRYYPPNTDVMTDEEIAQEIEQLCRLFDSLRCPFTMFGTDKIEDMSALKEYYRSLPRRYDHILADVVNEIESTETKSSAVQRAYYFIYKAQSEEDDIYTLIVGKGYKIDRVKNDEMAVLLRNYLVREFINVDIYTIAEEVKNYPNMAKAKPAIYNKEIQRRLCPNRIDFTRDHAEQSGLMRRTLMIKNFPAQIPPRALYTVASMRGTSFTMRMTPLQKDNARKLIDEQIRNKAVIGGKSQATEQMDAAQETMDIKNFYAEVTRNQNTIYSVNVYIEIYGKTLEDLANLEQQVKIELAGVGITYDQLNYEQRNGFSSVQPLGSDHFILCSNNLPSKTVAALYPFSYSSLIHPHGMPLGRTDRGGPVYADIFQRDDQITNGVFFISGSAGQGKSYLQKKILTFMVTRGVHCYVMDPENEYSDVTRGLGGVVIDCASGNHKINIFEVRRIKLEDDVEEGAELPEISNESPMFLQHLSWLKDEFRIMMPEMPDSTLRALMILVQGMYASVGIDQHTDFDRLRHEDYPTFSTLYDFVQKQLGKNSYPMLTKEMISEVLLYINDPTYGELSNIFNGTTTIDVKNNPLICFSMGALLEGSEQRLQAVENNLNTYIWSIVLLREFQVLLSFDELYMYLEQPLMAKYISYFARRSRKYNACIGVATQQLQDCLDESVRRYSSPIINMSSFKFLFYSGQVDLQDMKEALKLTDGEAACISVSNKRHCLLKAGNGKYYMEVGTLPFEAELFGDKGGI